MSLIDRHTTSEASEEKMFFAQVREDADIEIAALSEVLDGRIAVVTSGGCTALSLLAEGTGEIHAVDLNMTQNDLTELKAVAAKSLPWSELLTFLGARPGDPDQRRQVYQGLRDQLSPHARSYFDARPRAISGGVLHAGITEKFMKGLVATLRRGIVRNGVMEQILMAPDLATQRRLWEQGWDNRRWRAFLKTLCNRRVFDKVYAEGFFANTGKTSFADHFGGVIEHVLTELPTRTNPYAHDIITGHFGEDLPAYLREKSAGRIAESTNRLHLWDQPMTTWLATQAEGSLDGVTLSNICEWFTKPEIEELFKTIARALRPGGVVVLRNFVGWTDLPPSAVKWFDVDDRSDELSLADRSLMQYRVVVLKRREVARPRPPMEPTALGAADADELLALARSNPISSSTTYVVDRSRFGAVAERIPGARLIGGRVEDELVAVAAMIPFGARIAGDDYQVTYLGGVVADRAHPGRGVDIVEEATKQWFDSDSEVFVWLTNDDNERIQRTSQKDQWRDQIDKIVSVNYTEVLPQTKAKLPKGWAFREVPAADQEQVLAFINDYYADRNLYTPVSGADLTSFPNATSADLVALYDEHGTLRAAAWVWSPAPYAQVIPIKFDAMSKVWEKAVTGARKVGARLPQPPVEGEPLKTIHLRRLAFADPQAGKAMIGQLGNVVIDRRAHSLSYVDDPRVAIPKRHKLVFTYPGHIGARLKPGSRTDFDTLRSRPLFIDVSLT
jgi:S-adenosylmethionine-diacylglycerol 3-amino-3-carboxypropyl transferase